MIVTMRVFILEVFFQRSTSLKKLKLLNFNGQNLFKNYRSDEHDVVMTHWKFLNDTLKKEQLLDNPNPRIEISGGPADFGCKFHGPIANLTIIDRKIENMHWSAENVIFWLHILKFSGDFCEICYPAIKSALDITQQLGRKQEEKISVVTFFYRNRRQIRNWPSRWPQNQKNLEKYAFWSWNSEL